MRRLLISLMLPVLALLATAGPASASGPADHTLPGDIVFKDVNPCTGKKTRFAESFTKNVFHFTADASGDVHFTGTGVATIGTDDGFSGQLRFSLTGKLGSGPSGLEVETFAGSANLQDGSGHLFRVHAVDHKTVKRGTLVVALANASFACEGKPE